MNTDRLEAFSDGVFAIAITLLVLGIRVPPPDAPLTVGLLQLWPSYLAYAISFLVIGAIWINHHAMFRHIVRVDDALLLWNVIYLLFVAFLPFPTAVLAQAFNRGAGETTAAALYGVILTIIGLSVVGMWNYAASGHRLLDKRLSPQEARQIGRRFLIGPLIYAVATVVGLFAPWPALMAYLFLNIFYLWPRRGHVTSSGPTGDADTAGSAAGDASKYP